MALRTAGLQTAIWNNNLKSLVLLALYPLIVAAMFWAGVTLFGANMFRGDLNLWSRAVRFGEGMTLHYLPLIATGVAVWFVVAYFFQSKMIRALAHAAPVTRAQAPQLYRIMENLCIERGLSTPRINIIETDALNAFASGIDRNSYSITVTRGLLQALAPDELEAVLAHEISHILNKDVRLMIVSIIFVGMFGFFAQLLWSQLRWGTFSRADRGRNGGNIVLFLLAVEVILWLGYLTTLFTRLALSRHRESMADEGAITLTKNPEALMRALLRIDGRGRIPHASRDIARLCIDDEGGGLFGGLLSDHPPISVRVAQISRLTGVPVPNLDTLDSVPETPAAAPAAYAPPPASARNPWRAPGPRNPWQ